MDIVISNIGQLVTPLQGTREGGGEHGPLHVFHDTELCIHNGRIVDSIASRDPDQCRVFDAGGGVVVPGLIDPFWRMPEPPMWAQETGTDAPLETSQWMNEILRHVVTTGVTTIELKCAHRAELQEISIVERAHRHVVPRIVGSLLTTLREGETDPEQQLSSLIGEIIPEIRQRKLATFIDIGWSASRDVTAEARTVMRAAGGAGIRCKLHFLMPPQPAELEALVAAQNVAAIGCASYVPIEIVVAWSGAGVVPVYVPQLRRDECSTVDLHALLMGGLPLAIASGNGLRMGAPRSMWTVVGAAMDEYGLTLAESLAAATLGNAMALELEHEVGSLEIGKRADVILLDLSDYRELELLMGFAPIRCVVAGGELVTTS
jgi:imidazolonepropionase